MKNRAKKFVKRVRPTANPLRIDPTRTSTLRRQITAEMRRRFNRLKVALYNLIVVEDAFGLAPDTHDPFRADAARAQERVRGPKTMPEQDRKWMRGQAPEVVFNAPYAVLNARWKFQSSAEQVKAFQAWLRSQVSSLIKVPDDKLWDMYAAAGFRKGAGRAFDDVRRVPAGRQTLDFYRGTREEFLRSSFGRPESVEKIKLLAGRSFDDLDGVTSQMSTAMSRTLTDGLVRGMNPNDIARELDQNLDLGRSRAETIARTEIIRAHAEGQLTAMKELGVEEVGVAVEWSTAGDDRVCKLCEPLEGMILKLDEAAGMIPRHPNCRCAWIPANVGEPKETELDSKGAIDAAVRVSVAREGDDNEDGGAWGPSGEVSRDRPESRLNSVDAALFEFSRYAANAFCPTGPGGGFDNSCGGAGGGKLTLSEVDALNVWKLNAWGKVKTSQRNGTQLGKDFTSALMKQPEHVGDSFRGLAVLKDSDRYNLGAEVTFDTSESFSSDRDFAEGWAAEHPSVIGSLASGDREPVVLVVPPTSQMRDLDTIQREVVNLPGMRIRVVKHEMRNGVKHIITEHADPVANWKPLVNAFCPTGPGGGIDNTCGADDEGGAGDDADSALDDERDAEDDERSAQYDEEYAALVEERRAEDAAITARREAEDAADDAAEERARSRSAEDADREERRERESSARAERHAAEVKVYEAKSLEAYEQLTSRHETEKAALAEKHEKEDDEFDGTTREAEKKDARQVREYDALESRHEKELDAFTDEEDRGLAAIEKKHAREDADAEKSERAEDRALALKRKREDRELGVPLDADQFRARVAARKAEDAKLARDRQRRDERDRAEVEEREREVAAARAKQDAERAKVRNSIEDPLYAFSRYVTHGFCPTGVGGGLDNSCGREGGASKFVGATVGKAEHVRSEEIEDRVATALGGDRLDDNEPLDVRVRVGKKQHAVEVKSLLKGGKQVISVHPDALVRKMDFVEKNPGTQFHTVVVDDRDAYAGGEFAGNFSGHGLYYKRGSGRYSLSKMHRVKDDAELRKLIAAPDDKLPEAARGALPTGREAAKVREQAKAAHASRQKKDKARKARLKAAGKSAYERQT